MIRKVSDFIVRKKNLVLAFMVVLAVICGVGSQYVEINEDMTKYLPDDSSMKAGIDIMADEFPEIETSNSIRVMFDDLTTTQKETIENKLSAIVNVDSVDYDIESDDYNKDNHTLYVLNMSCDYGSDEEAAIEEALESQFADYTMVYKNNDSGFPGIPMSLIVMALTVLLIILFLMCGSWIEPILFLVVIGVAVIINGGTNVFLGSVASITNSISAILQLVLSMDYSIILMNRYRQEKELEPDSHEAMKNALTYSFSSVASSSLTTVVGLLMLIFMSFKIGANLGIVLAKGVFISMVCVLTMLPGIILACDGIIKKTAKKSLHIPTDWAAKFSYKLRYIMLGVFAILFIGSYILQQQTGIAYTLTSHDEIADIFPTSNTLVLVYENQDEEKVSELVDELEKDEKVKTILGYSTILGKSYSSSELADALGSLSDDISLSSNVIDMLYYNYFSDGKTGSMTASEFLTFISDTVLNDATFADYIDDSMKENVDMLEKFADPAALTKAMSASELADFFGMDVSNIKDLFLLYYMEEGSASTGTMTLPTFANFVINEVAKDPTYGAMFDSSTLNQMSMLATFTDVKKMTTPSTYKEIASMLGLDADMTKLLFVYYNAMSDSYTPSAMTLTEFVSFLQNDIATDPVFSSYLDEDTLAQINTLSALVDKTALQTKRSTTELSTMLGIDESLVETIFVLHNAQDVSDKTMTLAQFTGFLTGLMENPMFGSAFDEETKTQLTTMDKLIQTAASKTKLTTTEMSQILGMDEATLSQLYYLYYYSQNAEFQQEVAAYKMTLPDFLVLLKANSTQEQQAQLAQMEQLITIAVSGKKLDAATLASITGMSETQISGIFASQTPAVEAMTLPEFLSVALQGEPDNAQLSQLNGIVQLAVSGNALDSETIAQVFGIQEAQVQQLFGLTLVSQKEITITIALADFTGFLVNNVLSDEAYAGNFTEEQVAQLSTMNQMVQVAASGTGLDIKTLAQTFGMDESMIEMVFRLYHGSDITDKTMSLEEIVDFILTEPIMKNYLDEANVAQLQMIQQMIKAVVNEVPFTYTELSNLLGMDESMLKMLYTVKASATEASTWKISMQTIVNFLMNNSDLLGSMMGNNATSSLTLAQSIINGSVNGTTYTSNQIANLMGMSKDQANQLYLLYTSRHGNTSNWKLSVQDFINFAIEDVLSNSAYADKIDADSKEMLSSGKAMVDAVVSGEGYSSSQMGTLLSGLTDQIDSSMVDLLYLYAQSSENSNPEWTMNLETLFNYVSEDLINDPRFASVLDEDIKETLLDAGDTLEEGKKQLVSDKYSRLIITSSYLDEGKDTTAFFDNLEQFIGDNFNGESHLVGNAAMNYEMQKTFDGELWMITLLTALSIFIIVAFTFKSISIPTILVLLVQCGVYITIAITGFTSGSIYYLALLIVECILMGATVDYGILLTNYYVDARQTENVENALKKAYAGSIHTIMTSGLILVLVTAVVAGLFENPTVTAIVKTISMGALCASILILFVLPGVLAACDKIVIKKNKK